MFVLANVFDLFPKSNLTSTQGINAPLVSDVVKSLRVMPLASEKRGRVFVSAAALLSYLRAAVATPLRPIVWAANAAPALVWF